MHQGYSVNCLLFDDISERSPSTEACSLPVQLTGTGKDSCLLIIFMFSHVFNVGQPTSIIGVLSQATPWSLLNKKRGTERKAKSYSVRLSFSSFSVLWYFSVGSLQGHVMLCLSVMLQWWSWLDQNIKRLLEFCLKCRFLLDSWWFRLLHISYGTISTYNW